MKFDTSVAKKSKLKVKKFLELIPTLVEVTGEKLPQPPSPSPILNRVKKSSYGYLRQQSNINTLSYFSNTHPMKKSS